MRCFSGIGLCLAVFAIGCGETRQTAVGKRSEGPPPAARTEPATIPAGEHLIGRPIRFRNLTVFPVTSREPQMEDRFITLNEGLAAGTVEVLETGAEQLGGENAPAKTNPAQPDAANPEPQAVAQDAAESPPPHPPVVPEEDGVPQPQIVTSLPPDGNIVNDGDISFAQNFQPGFQQGNEVNRLVVINRSDKPLYLMPGEIISGGSQDRTIGRELVIQPDGKPLSIDVFCVESGRWHDRDESETQHYLEAAIANAARDDSVAVQGDVQAASAEANRGKFIASVGSLNKGARLAVQADMDQSKVWEEVSQQNARSMVTLDTSAFTANYVDAGAARLDEYLAQLQAPVENTENVVGVIVAVNGKVDSLDVFESTPLFKKLWPKLLKSYALDAASADAETDAAKVCRRLAARDFLTEATSGGVEQSEEANGIAIVRRATEDVVSFAAALPDAPAAGASFSGFSSVHASAFAK